MRKQHPITMFEQINLKKELIKERGTIQLPEKALLNEVKELLKHARQSDDAILSRLREGKTKQTFVEPIAINENELKYIFNLSQIKNVCINYRLRFLDPKLFKGDFPYEAIVKIREFEDRTGKEIKEFKLMAPSKMFKLLDPDKDPLLFANIGNGNYYLIHQWGNDLAWYRKYLVWPFRNLKNIIFTLLTLALLVTFFLPSSLIIQESKMVGQAYLGKMIFFLLFTLGLFGLTLRISLGSDKNLNELDWDNRFFY